MRCHNTYKLSLFLAVCVGVVFWGIVAWSKSVHPMIGSISRTPPPGRRYILVIDAGSSGTRMNAFTFVNGDPMKSSDIMLIPPSAAKDKVPKRSTETRRAYQRVETEPGLSNFVNDFNGIRRQVLEPLLGWAKAVVPESEWNKTPVFLFGTAGMRRLRPDDQENIMAMCRTVLKASGFKFDLSWSRVIRGVDEGMYGWVALNAMEDRLGGNDTLGALDLGGSSLEITYAVGSQEGGHTFPMVLGGRTYHVYTYSHRHAGLDDAFQRSIHILEKNATKGTAIKHPCIHEGFRENIHRIPLDGRSPLSPQVDVIGEPNEDVCDRLAVDVVKQTAPCTEEQIDNNCIMSSKHPKFPGTFAAMSGFYVVNHFYNLNTKSSLRDLSKITDSFCSLNWEQVQNKHKDEVAVETYCFRGEYVEALLETGLELDDTKLMLGYKSPGWPLGAALVHGFPQGSHQSLAGRTRPMTMIMGVIGCIFLAYLVAKARAYKASSIRRRLKGGSISSRGSFTALSMEQGETLLGWHQTSTTGSALSRSRTFSRRLNSLDSNESLN